MNFLNPSINPRSNARQWLTRLTTRFSKATLLLVAFMLVTPMILFVVKVSGQSGGSALLISESRVRGPNGANDEFIEVYNNTDSFHLVASSDGSSGYSKVELFAGSETNSRATERFQSGIHGPTTPALMFQDFDFASLKSKHSLRRAA